MHHNTKSTGYFRTHLELIAIDTVILTRIARYLLKCVNLPGLKEWYLGEIFINVRTRTYRNSCREEKNTPVSEFLGSIHSVSND